MQNRFKPTVDPSMIRIIDYEPVHQPYFEALNRAWIEEHFWLEEIDRFVLQQPEEAILKNGGAILMATWNDAIAGTVALKKGKDGVFEFTKMAVDPAFQRRGLAEALSEAAFQRLRSMGETSVILYSQTTLKAAIALYRKLGFVEVPLEPGVYQRSDIKMKRELDN